MKFIKKRTKVFMKIAKLARAIAGFVEKVNSAIMIGIAT